MRPTFRWAAIPGAARYRVRIFNHDNSQTILREWVTGVTEYTVPAGGLKPNALYRFRLDAVDAASDPDNYSRTPASGSQFYRFYTGQPGDVNGDGFVDMADAIDTLRALDGDPAVWVQVQGDTNADSRIGQPEALYILQEEAGLR